MAAWLARLSGLDCKASSATGGVIFNIKLLNYKTTSRAPPKIREGDQIGYV